jgi:hypothetical protein
MKGRQIRPQSKPDQARIIRVLADSTRDQFIPLAEAAILEYEKKIKPIHLGKEYPNAYLSY